MDEKGGEKRVVVTFGGTLGSLNGVWVPKWETAAWNCCTVLKEGELEKGIRGAVVEVRAPGNRSNPTVKVQINYN